MTWNQNPVFPSPPVPVVYEENELDRMTMRSYAAIHLRVPDSGIDWLDRMIERSRELDREREITAPGATGTPAER
jgi:hypothetical protein